MDWSDGEDDAPSLNINKDFAFKYETKKRGEELSKLQDKYGKDYVPSDDDESEESSSDDDEDAEFLTPQVDVAILKTLAKIRSKDPSVYDSSRPVFDEEEANVRVDSGVASKLGGQNGTKTKKDKPVLLKDYQRKRLLEDPEGTHEDSIEPTPAEEQERLRAETKKAFLGAVSSDSSSEEDDPDGSDSELLVRRDKSAKERKREETEYQEFLKTSAGQQAIEAALEKDEKFLNDYILNRGWVDKQDRRGHDGDEQEEDEDSEFEERAEQFETAYNFRFEDPNAADVITHSRNVPSVRKPSTQQSARARARQAAKEREEEEKVRRKEEVRRLKALKRKEIEDKLVQLAEAAGTSVDGLESIDLEGDWDAAKHDETMKRIYGSEYDEQRDKGFKPGQDDQDDGDEDEDGKPTWKDDIDISDLNIPEVDDEEAEQAIAFGDPNDGGSAESEQESKKEKKKSKKRKRDAEEFDAELVEAAKAGDEQRKQVVDGLLDSYYQVDYEDKIGDLKTRFHYTKVEPSSYGLSPAEILLATDAELNEYMSLRKIAPYRTKDDKKNRKKLKELRDRLKTREWGREVREEDAGEASQSRHGGHRKKKRKTDGDASSPEKASEKKKKRKGRKERKRMKESEAQSIDE